MIPVLIVPQILMSTKQNLSMQQQSFSLQIICWKHVEIGALNINALAAADEVIITVNPQLLAMMGLQDFLKTVKKIKSRINDKLDVAGILLTMCDARTNLCKVITEQVSDTFEGQIRIFDSKIPNTVKVGESVYYSEPLLEYASECKACEAYENLAKELIAYEG